jgi:hypothetical protein
MPEDEKRTRIRRLQEQADRQWQTPRAIALDGPGPFELPLCGRASLLGRGSDPTIVLLLETTKQSQPVRIPIPTDEIVALKALIDVIHGQYVRSIGSGH